MKKLLLSIMLIGMYCSLSPMKTHLMRTHFGKRKLLIIQHLANTFIDITYYNKNPQKSSDDIQKEYNEKITPSSCVTHLVHGFNKNHNNKIPEDMPLKNMTARDMCHLLLWVTFHLAEKAIKEPKILADTKQTHLIGLLDRIIKKHANKFENVHFCEEYKMHNDNPLIQIRTNPNVALFYTYYFLYAQFMQNIQKTTPRHKSITDLSLKIKLNRVPHYIQKNDIFFNIFSLQPIIMKTWKNTYKQALEVWVKMWRT